MKLFDHQIKARDFILQHGGSGAIFHEMGLGKTRTALEVFKSLRETVVNLKMLVVCPLSLIEAAWGSDIRKFTNFRYKNLRKKEIMQNPDIYLINYESFITAKMQDEFRWMGCNMVVIDESSRMKNHSAKTTKILLKLRDYFKYRLVMSGTPAPNSEMEYWGQMRFVSQSVPESFFAYRNIYFHLERGNQRMNSRFMPKMQMQEIFRTGWKYAITQAKREALMERIGVYIHKARKDECLDLPERTDEIRQVELTQKQMKYYKEMKRNYLIEIEGKTITAQVALTKIMKLRQITSGFALDEHGEARQLTDNVKMDELKAILEEAGDQQIIIWCQFRHEIRTIRKLLEGKCVDLYGETEFKDENIEKFRDGKAQYLIAHPRSAGHGLTFVSCSLQVFYSMDYSWEAYEQSKARIHRVGQVKPCTYVHILAQDTIDESIYKVLKNKGNMQEILYELRK